MLLLSYTVTTVTCLMCFYYLIKDVQCLNIYILPIRNKILWLEDLHLYRQPVFLSDGRLKNKILKVLKKFFKYMQLGKQFFTLQF